jgi:hypothetical protein
MTRERLYLFDTTLRARLRAGAVRPERARHERAEHKQNKECRRASFKEDGHE